ncbi:MAG: hypothetical protein PHD95_00925 [Candidatus ainarchaeum sp.]|nr:hypothetical protein [Candidatus ainarchaeum sp.]
MARRISRSPSHNDTFGAKLRVSRVASANKLRIRDRPGIEEAEAAFRERVWNLAKETPKNAKLHTRAVMIANRIYAPANPSTIAITTIERILQTPLASAEITKEKQKFEARPRMPKKKK